MIAKFEPPPPIRLHLGRTAVGRRPLLTPGGYQITASADLDVLNQVLASLWDAGTIPHELDIHPATLDDLERECLGVPNTAQQLRPLGLLAPPVVSASDIPANVRVRVRIQQAIEGSADDGLVCALDIEMFLGFEITNSIHLAPEDFQGAVVVLTVDPASTIVPITPEANVKLANLFQAALPGVGLELEAFAKLPTVVGGVGIHTVDAV